MNYPIRTFVEIDEEELNQLKQTIAQQQAEIAELKNARDHWCLQYKNVFNKLESNCYGDGNVYRGVRSKDSEVQTIHIGGVRELSDEELDSIIASFPYPRTHAMDKHMIKLALRKAQEK